MYNSDNDSDSAYCRFCRQELPTAVPAIYRPPFGLPLNWQDETSGTLPAAVRAFIGYQADRKARPTAVQLWLVAEYIRHHINAPCWDMLADGEDGFGPEVAALREKAEGLESCEDIAGYIRQALEIGIDPL
jgi:hypothetical protein